jgi:hypothetical protein
MYGESSTLMFCCFTAFGSPRSLARGGIRGLPWIEGCLRMQHEERRAVGGKERA